jgi:PAS domain S-box-containing protein
MDQVEKKLLLADDEADIREILHLYISDMGYQVFTAEDGDQALDLFRKEKPVMVVTDIKMPGIDGIDLLRKIKTESPDTEVIMITGHGDLDLAIKSLKYEAADFITKPINTDMLEVSLNRAYEKVSMRKQIRSHHENLHRLVQEELRTARHKYHQLFEVAPCYITVQDKNLIITESNRLFKEHFGETGGQHCYKIYRHRSGPCEECPVVRTFEDEQSHQMETVVTSRTGQQYHVLIITAPIRDSEGRITHVMEVSTNITQIRELQDRLTSLGLLIGSVSHGIKGVLTGLDAGMYQLKRGLTKGNPSDVEEGFDVMKEMAGRIRKQVLDILYYAKDRTLELETVDVLTFAESLAMTVEPKAKMHGIGFARHVGPSLGTFEIEPSVVSSALVNILENAVEACVYDRSKPSHGVDFRVTAEGEDILFDIQDNGMGMDQETREKLFTLFFSSKGSKGTGLGLFIANKMIRQHGGSIQVESEPGQGTRFILRIPRVQNK